jgi:NADH:ubiquinone oxidoreductase subunit 6 (subunit J)
MSISTLLLYSFEVIAALSALGILFVRNVFYGALLLICCLLSVAALFVFFHAEFVAITQILVYAGGVLVLILFGIMLSSKISGKPLVVHHNYVISGAVLGISLLGLLSFALFKSPMYSATDKAMDADNISSVGINMMSNHILPFEIAGILLLVALIGAVVVASSKPKST